MTAPARATEPPVVTALSGADSLAALEPEWWALWRRCPAATPFQSPAWLLPWWDAFRPGRLAVVAVRRAGVLVGLAPCYVEAAPGGPRLLPLGIAVSDYLDVLVDGDAGAALARGIAALPGIREWQMPALRAGAAALALPCPPGWHFDHGTSSACMALSLRRGEDGLPADLPTRQRRKLRMAMHRARRRGAVSVLHADRESGPFLVAQLARLHAACWQARGGDGVLADPRFRDFLAAAAPRLLAAGLLRLQGLVIDGAVAAVVLCLQHRTRRFAYLSGYDPAFAFESPGSLLLSQTIADALEEGVEELDFMRGDEGYKAAWGCTRHETRRLVMRLAGPGA